MLMQRTEEERLIMGCAMRNTARKLVEASLMEQNLLATEAKIRKGVFLRFLWPRIRRPDTRQDSRRDRAHDLQAKQ
ncbi:MAG: hypothetical protein FJ244_03860 [Nitrospira sp.]|nr:hypothetical protein [Nitrospira sp.]